MRILYHHRTLADGAEGIHIAEMVSAFRGLGHEVRVLGLAASGPHAAARGGLVRGVRSVLPAAAFEAASILINVAERRSVAREIRQFAPDFLYKRHARYDVGALLAARAAGVPAILEVNALFSASQYHGFEPLALPRIARRMERQALRLGSQVIAVSTPLAREIRAIADVDAAVVPNGANPERFDPRRANGAAVRARYALHGDAPVIGWAGVLRDWHGLELLLDAVGTVAGARLLIIGDGPARAAVEARAASLGLGGRVAITGRIPHEQMPDHLAAVDIAVVADDRTGVASPMKLLEYMAMGRVVVAPRLENITDLVTDGENGLLFESGNTASLTATLTRAACDRGLRERLQANARDTIERTRNWRRIALDVLAMVPAAARGADARHGSA